MPSYLSNYDPTAFNEGIAWAAQRQAARDAITRQAQEQEAQKARLEQEGEIQARNQAAHDFRQFQHDADEAKQQTSDEWRKGIISTADVNYNAAYNDALEQRAGAANQGEWNTYIQSLQEGQQYVHSLDPSKPVDSAKLVPPKAPVRIPSQAELDTAKAEIQKIADVHSLSVARAASAWSTVGKNRAYTAKLATQALNPATKLNSYQNTLARNGHKALSSLPVYIANTPKHQQSGLVFDDLSTTSNERVNELGGNYDVSHRAMMDFSQNVGSVLAGVSDPSIARTWGLTPEAAQFIKDAAPVYGGLQKPSQWHQFMGDLANPGIRSDPRYPASTRQVILSAINNNPYTDPEPVQVPPADDAGGGD